MHKLEAIFLLLFSGNRNRLVELVFERAIKRPDFEKLQLVNEIITFLQFQKDDPRSIRLLPSFKRLYSTLDTQGNTTVNRMLRELLSDVLYHPATVRLRKPEVADKDNPPRYILHLPLSQFTRTRSLHIHKALKGQTFLMTPSPLIVFVERDYYNSVSLLPHQEIKIDISEKGQQKYTLYSLMCRLDKDLYQVFTRVVEQERVTWWSATPDGVKEQLDLDFENRFSFWRNMPDFSEVLLEKTVGNTIKTIMEKAVLLVYFPTSEHCTPSSPIMPNPKGQSSSFECIIPQRFLVDVSDSREGCPKGIEGDSNSCFIDTFLMSLFFNKRIGTKFIKQHFELISPGADKVQDMNPVVSSLLEIEKKLSQPPYYCDKNTVWRLRHTLSKENPGVLGNMMDVEELLLLLLKRVLGLPAFITYETNRGTRTASHFHQIINSSNHTALVGILSNMLQESLQIQKLAFARPPNPLFIVKMPRADGKLVGYECAFPDFLLDFAMFMPGTTAAMQYQLEAVICLEHKHYVCFINGNDGNGTWHWFDSMGPKGPEVIALSNFEKQVNNVQKNLTIMDEKYIRRFLQCAHICFYKSLPEQKQDAFENFVESTGTVLQPNASKTEEETLTPAKKGDELPIKIKEELESPTLIQNWKMEKILLRIAPVILAFMPLLQEKIPEQFRENLQTLVNIAYKTETENSPEIEEIVNESLHIEDFEGFLNFLLSRFRIISPNIILHGTTIPEYFVVIPKGVFEGRSILEPLQLHMLLQEAYSSKPFSVASQGDLAITIAVYVDRPNPNLNLFPSTELPAQIFGLNKDLVDIQLASVVALDVLDCACLFEEMRGSWVLAKRSMGNRHTTFEHTAYDPPTPDIANTYHPKWSMLLRHGFLYTYIARPKPMPVAAPNIGWIPQTMKDSLLVELFQALIFATFSVNSKFLELLVEAKTTECMDDSNEFSRKRSQLYTLLKHQGCDKTNISLFLQRNQILGQALSSELGPIWTALCESVLGVPPFIHTKQSSVYFINITERYIITYHSSLTTEIGFMFLIEGAPIRYSLPLVVHFISDGCKEANLLGFITQDSGVYSSYSRIDSGVYRTTSDYVVHLSEEGDSLNDGIVPTIRAVVYGLPSFSKQLKPATTLENMEVG